MSRYRKVDPRFWKDEKIINLPSQEKLIALYLFTGQSNRIGIFNFSPGEAMEDLGIALESFAEGWAKPFGNVCRALNLGWDETFRVLYLPTWWKYNCPENPNVLKSCLVDLHEIPQTGLISEFSSNHAYLPETFHQTFREGLAKPSPQRMPHQEQEQEQEYKSGAAPDSPSSISKRKRAKTTSPEDPEFEKAWSLYPKRGGSDPKEKARKAWRARVHEGADPLIMIAGIERYAAYVRAVEWEETQYVKQAATFFGPDKHFLDQWTIPKKPTINGSEQERRPEPIERTPVVKWAIN